MSKYTDAKYPDKINDFIDNEGELSEEAKERVKEAGGLPDASEASAGDMLQLDSNKKPVWGAISGGTKLYKHQLNFNNMGTVTIISTVATKKFGKENTTNFINNLHSLGIVGMALNGNGPVPTSALILTLNKNSNYIDCCYVTYSTNAYNLNKLSGNIEWDNVTDTVTEL